MAFPIRGKEDSPQIRMFVKDDSEEVEDFALKVLRASPDGRDRGEAAALARNRNFQNRILSLRDGIDAINHLQGLAVIHRSNVCRVLEAGLFDVLSEVEKNGGLGREHGLMVLLARLDYPLRKSLLDFFQHNLAFSVRIASGW